MYNANMKSKFIVSCFLLLVVFEGSYGSPGAIESVEKNRNHPFDIPFLEPLFDLLEPQNILKSEDKTTGQKLEEIVKLTGAKNYVVNAATTSTAELIQMHGYPVEVYTVTTNDSYKINLHRIPRGKSGKRHQTKGVVLIPPSLMCSSACWVFLGPGKALPYLLADLGYDVWLSNVRGNTYGRKHQTLNPDKDSDFWQWSFHEIGMFDFPATIDYILQKTKKKNLFLIAHSSSTTAAFVMLSEKPEYNKKIKTQFSLSPMAYMNHLKNPLLYFLAQFIDIWNPILHLVGYNEFLPKDILLTRLGGAMCNIDPISELMCLNAMFVLAGFNRESINDTYIPLIYGHTPSGTSLTNLMHYAQLMRIGSKKFQYFDNGLILNIIKYGTADPPIYSLNRISTPTYCFYGRNDMMVNEKDAVRTCKELSSVKHTFVVSDPKWTHNDFVYSFGAKEEVYDKIIELLQKND